MISRILGHKSLQTAISNYAGEDIAIARRAFHELIAEAMSGRTRRAGLHEVAAGLDPTTRKRRA